MLPVLIYDLTWAEPTFDWHFINTHSNIIDHLSWVLKTKCSTAHFSDRTITSKDVGAYCSTGQEQKKQRQHTEAVYDIL